VVDGNLIALSPHFGGPVVLRECLSLASKRGAMHYKLAGLPQFPEVVDEACYNEEVVREVVKQNPGQLLIL
jgi:hypothetical protein